MSFGLALRLEAACALAAALLAALAQVAAAAQASELGCSSLDSLLSRYSVALAVGGALTLPPASAICEAGGFEVAAEGPVHVEVFVGGKALANVTVEGPAEVYATSSSLLVAPKGSATNVSLETCGSPLGEAFYAKVSVSEELASSVEKIVIAKVKPGGSLSGLRTYSGLLLRSCGSAGSFCAPPAACYSSLLDLVLPDEAALVVVSFGSYQAVAVVFPPSLAAAPPASAASSPAEREGSGLQAGGSATVTLPPVATKPPRQDRGASEAAYAAMVLAGALALAATKYFEDLATGRRGQRPLAS